MLGGLSKIESCKADSAPGPGEWPKPASRPAGTLYSELTLGQLARPISLHGRILFAALCERHKRFLLCYCSFQQASADWLQCLFNLASGWHWADLRIAEVAIMESVVRSSSLRIWLAPNSNFSAWMFLLDFLQKPFENNIKKIFISLSQHSKSCPGFVNTMNYSLCIKNSRLSQR